MPESQAVIEVNDHTFEADVVARSREVPVVVDFWAPWCGPCRALGPVLEQLATEADGEWVLAKINVDNNQQSAQRFGVRGIPAVKAFRDGELVDEFTGALPQAQIEQWLDGFLPDETDAKIAEARALEDAGQWDQATAIYEAVQADQPGDTPALLGLARVSAARGEHDEAAQFLDEVSEHAHDAEFYRVWLEVEAANTAPREALQARVEDNPGDLEAQYELGVRLAAAGSFDAALEHLLQIVLRDRAFRDDLGRETMVRIFQVMGSNTDQVREWQKRLGRAMY